MAKHADTNTLELTDVTEPNETDAAETAPSSDGSTNTANSDEGKYDSRRPTISSVVVATLAISAALAAQAGWMGYGNYQRQQRQSEWDQYLAVGRQAAVNLTTIDFNEANADVSRIVNSATGTFRDDFQKRSPSFIDAVKQARSKSQGAVTEAGVQSIDGGHGQVVVAVQVKSSTDGVPVGEPRGWRMRIDVQKIRGDYKVANVQFVP